MSVRYLLCLFFLIGSFCLTAQLTATIKPDAAANMSPQEQGTLPALISQKLADYERLLENLLDPITGKPIPEIRQEIDQLFDPTGNGLINDLKEVIVADPIQLDGYLQRIEQYFAPGELSFYLNRAEIIGRQPGTKGYVELEVAVNKSIQSYYDDSYDIQEGSLNHELLFTFSYPENDPTRIRIESTSLFNVRPADLYTRIVGLDLGYGSGQISHPDIRMEGELSGGNELSLGAFLLSNSFLPAKSPIKSLFLALGGSFYQRSYTLNIGSYAATETLTNVSAETFDGIPIQDFTLIREGRISEVEETQRFVGLRIQAGLSYLFLNRSGKTAFVTLQYAPNLTFSTSGEISGQGTSVLIANNFTLPGGTVGASSYRSDGPQAINPNDANFREAYGFGGDDQVNGKPSLKTETVHGILFSVSYFNDLLNDNPTYGIGLSLRYYLPFTDSWAADAAGNPLGASSDLGNVQNSTLPFFAGAVSSGFIGFGAHVYLKNRRRP